MQAAVPSAVRCADGAGVKFTADIAECIYIGVSTDTGCFKFSNTTAHSHAVAAACLTAGIDGGEINRVLFETKSRPRFEMERIVFDTMEFHENGAIAVAVLWRRDIDHAGADMDDLDSIASLTRQIEGVQIGITLTEKPDGTVSRFRPHHQGDGRGCYLQEGRRRRSCPCGRCELHLRHGRGEGRDAVRSEGAVPCSRLSFRVSC